MKLRLFSFLLFISIGSFSSAQKSILIGVHGSYMAAPEINRMISFYNTRNSQILRKELENMNHNFGLEFVYSRKPKREIALSLRRNYLSAEASEPNGVEVRRELRFRQNTFSWRHKFNAEKKWQFMIGFDLNVTRIRTRRIENGNKPDFSVSMKSGNWSELLGGGNSFYLIRTLGKKGSVRLCYQVLWRKHSLDKLEGDLLNGYFSGNSNLPLKERFQSLGLVFTYNIL